MQGWNDSFRPCWWYVAFHDVLSENKGALFRGAPFRKDKVIYGDLSFGGQNSQPRSWTLRRGCCGLSELFPYVLAVPQEVSEKYNLTKLSQLITQAPNLHLGCTTAFTQREDLLPKMKKDFGINFKEVVGLEGNIRYQAITSGEVEVTDAYETDALVMKSNLVRLEDDISFFPPYQAVNVFRSEVLEDYPELMEVLPLLDNAITTDEMLEMNYQVDVEGKTTEEVAHNFLASKGLI